MRTEDRGGTRRLGRLRAGAALAGALPFGLLALTHAGCSNGAVAHAPDAGAPIIIGVTLALHNDLAGTGVPLQNAIRVAERQINSYGGLLGRPVEYRIVDDETDKGDLIRQRVTELIDQGAVALLGPIGSSQASAIQNIITTRGVPEISANSTSTLLTSMQSGRHGWFFRTVPPDSLQAVAIANLAYGAPKGDGGAVSAAGGCRKMAIVHNDDDYGNPFASALTSAFMRLGGTVVKDVPVPGDVQADYSAQANLVIAATPDCQALIVYNQAADGYLSSFDKVSPGKVAAGFFSIGTDGAYNQQFITGGRVNPADPSSTSVAEGVYGTNPASNPPTNAFGQFRNLYTATYPTPGDLPGNVANMYDAAILAALAIEQAGSTADRGLIRDALFQVSKGGRSFGPSEVADALAAIRNGMDIDYNGASGNCDFDDKGDVIGDYIVWRVQKGAFVTVETIAGADLVSR